MKRSILLPLMLLLPLNTFAHAEAGLGEGFSSGFLHPITGLDHMVAMLAVGLWGSILGGQALWILPVTFPIVMAIGGAMGIAGFPLPEVETAIALSGVVLGAMVAIRAQPPHWLAYGLVGLFAVFHGHAHGTELPAASGPLAYGLGFILATGLMHIAGILIGLLHEKPGLKWVVTAAGVFIAFTGLFFLFA